MLPLPKKLSALITAPVKALLSNSWSKDWKEMTYIIIVYGTAFILLSFPFDLFFRG
jgi:hypothetical protein